MEFADDGLCLPCLRHPAALTSDQSCWLAEACKRRNVEFLLLRQEGTEKATEQAGAKAAFVKP